MPNPIPGFAPSYNGVVFPVETETMGIRITPKKSTDGRTRITNVYDITLKAEISDPNIVGGASADNTMDSLRKRLTTPGGAFAYSNMGIGQLSVNVGNVRDVEWGPWPDMLSWKPNGANNTVEIVWNVKVSIPDCDNAQFQFAPMEFNYKLEIDIDRGGYSTRRYSGFIRIPQTRKSVNDRTLSDNADRYREQIIPRLLPGFRRTMGPFLLSDDKCRLDFSIVDEEMGLNIPPPGIVEVKADHSIDGTPKQAIVGGIYTGRLTATYEVARDFPKIAAHRYFFQMFQDRFQKTLAIKPVFPPQAGQKADKFVLITSIGMREQIYEKQVTASFSLTYKFLMDLNQLLKASGLWTPVPNSSWAAWQGSLLNSAFHPRGNAKLAFQNSDDAIVDLCAPQALKLAGGGGVTQAVLKAQPFLFTPIQPPESTSWMLYKSRLRLEVIDQTVEMKPLSQATITTQSLNEPTPVNLTTNPGALGGAPSTGLPTTDLSLLSNYATLQVNVLPPSLIQVRAAPTVYIHLEGYAMRAGWQISPPSLVSVGGQPCIPANRQGDGFHHEIVANYYGVLVDFARWKLRYLLPGVPEGALPIPPVPNQGIV